MKDSNLLLFENKIYSTNPEDPKNQFIGPDPLYYYMFENPDEEIMEVLKPEIGMRSKLPQTNKIYLPDEILTNLRISIRNSQKNPENRRGEREYNLSCIRKVIVNDTYPVYIEFIRKFKHWTAKRKMELVLGNYCMEFGRLKLVHKIQYLKYEPAIPELREIILHDRDSRMTRAAIWALRDIKTKKSFKCLNELLLEKDLTYSKRSRICDEIENQGSMILLPGLRSSFEEYYYYYPEDSNYIYYNCTIQQDILKACSKIPNIKAFELLELGIKHPYSHIERTAYFSIKNWINLMLMTMQHEKDIKLGFKIAKIIKQYDFTIFKESWAKLPKKSTDFKFH